MPYPVSTLSPKIIPNDLTSFKSRGISQVERELEQKLTEIREEYIQTVDQYNWNKLIYEAEIHFEPVLGQTYYLYRIRGKELLSMIPPHDWPQPYLGSFRLNLDKQWEIIEIAKDVDKAALFHLV